MKFFGNVLCVPSTPNNTGVAGEATSASAHIPAPWHAIDLHGVNGNQRVLAGLAGLQPGVQDLIPARIFITITRGKGMPGRAAWAAGTLEHARSSRGEVNAP